jgi:hypothetical protein
VRTVGACLFALLACAALASAVGDVDAGRTYVGTIGASGTTGATGYTGSSLWVTVSADGKMATQIAALYSTCGQEQPFDVPEVGFPNAPIVHGAFKTTRRAHYRRSSHFYERVTITGRFESGGRVTGTITAADNLNPSGGTGPPCVTTNPWSGNVRPPGFGACEPVSLVDANANYVTDQSTSCKVVVHEIRQGYTGQGVYRSPPGWTCRRVRINVSPVFNGLAHGGHRCARGRARFQFVIV